MKFAIKHFFIFKIICSFISIIAVICLLIMLSRTINLQISIYNWSGGLEPFRAEQLSLGFKMIIGYFISIIALLLSNILIWLLRPLSSDKLHELQAEIAERRRLRMERKRDALIEALERGENDDAGKME
ncbi:MAG: hypothetical protein LBP62_07040 [Clostridiales bacterium]|jgi:hypothetical protein|nr:hypothetical protein [Clostridiales bacterium]